MRETDYYNRRRDSTNNAYWTAKSGVPVRFKQLRDFSFDVLLSPWGRW
jgi:hypothetical protein